MMVAKIMLGVFGGLGVLSLAMTVRLLQRPAEPNPAKLVATKRSLLLSSWIMVAVVGNTIAAVRNREYYLLWASGLLFSYILPLIVQYFRIRAALKYPSRPNN